MFQAIRVFAEKTFLTQKKTSARFAVALTTMCIGAAQLHSQSLSGQAGLRVESGVKEDGTATAQWLAMVKQRESLRDYVVIARVRKLFTDEESAWYALIYERVSAWLEGVPGLSALYSPVRVPRQIVVVLGNRGAADAFTHDDHTIGFDVSELQLNYGSAKKPESVDLIDRLFRHEFMHVMQKGWFKLHPFEARTSLGYALTDIWTEGIGNYQSLSAKWMSNENGRSQVAKDALAELEVRFVTRLSALACVSPPLAPALLKDLSSGPFAKKWGALPAALWLEAEQRKSPDAMRRFIEAGPKGVWDLAERNLSPQLRPAFREVQKIDSLCTVH